MTADDDGRTGPPTGHADLDTLADLHAGALDGPDAEAVRQHAAGCRQCAAALAALDAVHDQLRSLPAPELPAPVAARLDATLADLRTGRTDRAAAGATVADREDELARVRLRRGRRLSRAIGAAAAAVVVIAAGGAITSIVRSNGGNENTASGAGSAGSAPVQPQASAPLPKTDRGSLSSDSGGEAALPEYDRATLRAALPTIAGRGTAPRAAALGDAARQSACASSIPGARGSLRGVQHISYDGRPAYVLVYADGGRLTGFIVTEACGSASGLPATVLDTVS